MRSHGHARVTASVSHVSLRFGYMIQKKCPSTRCSTAAAKATITKASPADHAHVLHSSGSPASLTNASAYGSAGSALERPKARDAFGGATATSLQSIRGGVREPAATAAACRSRSRLRIARWSRGVSPAGTGSGRVGPRATRCVSHASRLDASCGRRSGPMPRSDSSPATIHPSRIHGW